MLILTFYAVVHLTLIFINTATKAIFNEVTHTCPTLHRLPVFFHTNKPDPIFYEPFFFSSLPSFTSFTFTLILTGKRDHIFVEITFSSLYMYASRDFHSPPPSLYVLFHPPINGLGSRWKATRGAPDGFCKEVRILSQPCRVYT